MLLSNNIYKNILQWMLFETAAIVVSSVCLLKGRERFQVRFKRHQTRLSVENETNKHTMYRFQVFDEKTNVFLGKTKEQSAGPGNTRREVVNKPLGVRTTQLKEKKDVTENEGEQLNDHPHVSCFTSWPVRLRLVISAIRSVTNEGPHYQNKNECNKSSLFLITN